MSHTMTMDRYGEHVGFTKPALTEHIAAIVKETPISLTIGELLRLAPHLRNVVYREWADAVGQEAPVPPPAYQVATTVADCDEDVPIISVRIAGKKIKDVIVDSGSGVGIMSAALFRRLHLRGLQPTPFLVRMANQAKIMPFGILRQVKVAITVTAPQRSPYGSMVIVCDMRAWDSLNWQWDAKGLKRSRPLASWLRG